MSKVALITGGTRGIGLGISLSLAKEGYHLAVNGVRPEEKVQDVLKKFSEYNAQVIYCQADISQPTERQNMLEQIRSKFGRLDLLVNNAGVAPAERKDILEATEESFGRLIRINLQGPYFLTQSVANWMIEQQKQFENFQGCIIFITSISATVASINRGEYCISKAGLSMASRLWAVRLAEFNIPVYEIRPGIIETDMTAGVKEKYDKLIANGLTLEKRWGKPEDIGKAVAALARGDLPYSTGQILTMDGGMNIPRL